MIKAVIVDDEPKAIQSLSWELGNFKEEISIECTFSSPEKALDYLRSNAIDCLFLDIQMPTMDGFSFLNQIPERQFAVIITTAYNEYAIKALKHEAIDYLVKPIDSDDLSLTIQKIKKFKQKSQPSTHEIEEMLLNFNAQLGIKKVVINTDGKLLFLYPDEILFVESDGNYCTLHLENSQKLVITKKLKEVNELLPESTFFRIHNSYIVNLTKIKAYIKNEAYVILDTNQKIPVARQRKSDFLERI